MLQAEKFRQFIFFQFRADDAEPAGIVRMPRAHLVFLRYIVELQPRAVLAVDNAFGPEDCAVRIRSRSPWVKALGVSLPQEENTSSAWW